MESINNEEKTLIHVSHLHPLKLVACPEPCRPICQACHMTCANQSYGCIDCRYFLHVTCASTGHSMDHPSHPTHTLKFELTPYYSDGKFWCDGCKITSTTFSLGCRECKYDLHLTCAAIPHKINHPSDNHPLCLFFKEPNPSAPDNSYYCGLCNGNIDVSKWFYYCDICNFGGHVGCFAPETVEVVSSGLQRPTDPEPEPQEPQQNRNTQAELQQLYTSMIMADSMRLAIRGMRI